MHRRSKFLLAGLAAALALAAATGVAQARRFEFSNQSFRIIWRELIYNGGGQEIRCPVTYEGSFHSRTISKVCGQLVGYIYNAQIGTCSGGAERYLTETLPWHVQYDAFTGVLPNITDVRVAVIGLSWRVERIAAFGSGCLFRSTQARPLFGDIELSGGRVVWWREEEASRIPFVSGEILCPAEIAFGSGIGTMTAREGATLTVRLVQ
jgi:hypothetical protein